MYLIKRFKNEYVIVFFRKFESIFVVKYIKYIAFKICKHIYSENLLYYDEM